MKAIQFLKEYVGLHNGDLLFLLAFKYNWELTSKIVSAEMGIAQNHAYNLLESFRTHGYCKKEKIFVSEKDRIPGRRDRNLYIFNDTAKKIVKKIFEKKIQPKIPLTPEEFKTADELNLIIEKK